MSIRENRQRDLRYFSMLIQISIERQNMYFKSRGSIWTSLGSTTLKIIQQRKTSTTLQLKKLPEKSKNYLGDTKLDNK